MKALESKAGADVPEPNRSTAPGRVAAIIEVMFVFVAVHVVFRAIKHFTAWGRLEQTLNVNFIPGTVMILFTLAVLLVCRRSFAAYGISLVRLDQNLKIGLLCGALLVAGVGFLTVLGVRHQPGVRPPTMMEGVVYGLAGLAAVVLLAYAVARQQSILSRFSVLASVLLFMAVLCLPLMVALHYQRPVGHTLLKVLWLLVGAACGEEIFYRGYIQSRVNGAFGRPFGFLGVQFGVGLLVASLLFGFLHTLNTVDYFNLHFTFAWGFGLASMGAGFLYGCLREITGSVVAGVVTHAMLDILVIIPGLISAP